jgi:hypothetical protein
VTLSPILNVVKSYEKAYGKKALVREVVGVPAACLVMGAIAFGTAALVPSGPEPVPVSAHAGNGQLSQVRP